MRQIKEVPGGSYDKFGFYNLPDGGKYHTKLYLNNTSSFFYKVKKKNKDI